MFKYLLVHFDTLVLLHISNLSTVPRLHSLWIRIHCKCCTSFDWVVSLSLTWGCSSTRRHLNLLLSWNLMRLNYYLSLGLAYCYWLNEVAMVRSHVACVIRSGQVVTVSRIILMCIAASVTNILSYNWLVIVIGRWWL